MILLALVLSWSIRSLIPVPQPAFNGTPEIYLLGDITNESTIKKENIFGSHVKVSSLF